MRLFHLIAAALLMLGLGTSIDASAQRRDGYSQSDRRDDVRGDRGERRYDGRDNRRYDGRDNRRYDRHDNRRYDRYDRRRDRHWGRNDRRYRWNNHYRPCRVVYRNHRRFTVCR